MTAHDLHKSRAHHCRCVMVWRFTVLHTRNGRSFRNTEVDASATKYGDSPQADSTDQGQHLRARVGAQDRSANKRLQTKNVVG